MEPFDLSDLDRWALSAEAKESMLEVILAWAYLDGALSIWVAAKFNVPGDKAAILLGRTDGPGKLRKLQKLYSLEGESEAARRIRKATKDYEELVKHRNILAHAGCLGSLKSDPGRVVFAAYETHKLGQLAIEVIPLAQMKKSSEWARNYAAEVERILPAI